MIVPGQTLYVLECEPAAYAPLASERGREGRRHQRARGSRRRVRWVRVYLGGEERDIDVGWRAAVAALEGLDGRE